jgi:hypothetical protein
MTLDAKSLPKTIFPTFFIKHLAITGSDLLINSITSLMTIESPFNTYEMLGYLTSFEDSRTATSGRRGGVI